MRERVLSVGVTRGASEVTAGHGLKSTHGPDRDDPVGSYVEVKGHGMGGKEGEVTAIAEV